jgi:hypothetical protein
MAQDKRRPADLDLASAEGGLLGDLFGFHIKSMKLLRQSSLDDEKLTVVVDRIKSLLGDITAEIKRTKAFDMSGQLEAAYDEVERLVDELAGSGEGGEEG